eukprot:383495_1
MINNNNNNDNEQFSEDLNVMHETDFDIASNGELNTSIGIKKQETNISIPPPPPPLPPIQQPITPITPYAQSPMDMYNYLYILQQQAYYNYYYRNGYNTHYSPQPMAYAQQPVQYSPQPATYPVRYSPHMNNNLSLNNNINNLNQPSPTIQNTKKSP